MEQIASQIAERIRNWDRQDVRVLRDMIAELREVCGEYDDMQAYIDMTSLPTVEIPESIDTSYPVWAVDVSGNALVGDAADLIEPMAMTKKESECPNDSPMTG